MTIKLASQCLHWGFKNESLLLLEWACDWDSGMGMVYRSVGLWYGYGL